MTTEIQNREAGKLILLNGPSSAGKTTLSLAIQEQAEVPFIHFSFDHLRDSNALPMDKIRDGRIDWSKMRPAVFDGFHRCLPALAGAGNNLIVDHIIESADWLADLAALLSSFDVFFVAVHCPPAVLAHRERERGDRRPGEALADYETVHSFSDYDFAVDSTNTSTSNAQAILAAWRQHSGVSALHKKTARR